MATENNTALAAQLETISNTLWRIKSLADIAAHCLFDEQLESPTVAVLVEIIAEMADTEHSNVTSLECELTVSANEPHDQPDFSLLDELEEVAA